MHLLRVSLVASALLAFLPACNFIFNPDGDGVIRCDNADDCDAPLQAALSDKRGQSACGAAGGGGSDFNQSVDNKVCSIVDREDVSCNPEVLIARTGTIAKVLEDAAKQADSYDACTSDRFGTLGCPPAGGTCTQGVVRTYTSVTGNDAASADQSGTERKICAPDGVAAVEPNGALESWDVLDQHCRSFFCDESFVCSRGKGSADYKCRRCDPELPYGAGGCGTMFIYGAASTVYVDGTCLETANADETEFGPVVPMQAPPMP
jgi:hypothetical protein